MYDSITENFDRVSALNDNGSTSSRGQQDEYPESAKILDNTTNDATDDIMTIYPLWSLAMDDRVT